MFSFLLSDEEFQSSEERGGQFIANGGLVGPKAVIESVIALRGIRYTLHFITTRAPARGRAGEGIQKDFFAQ